MSWKDARERRAEVLAAFNEGHAMGLDMRELAEAWAVSNARRKLEKPLPPEARCKCGSDRFHLGRADALWICSSCMRPQTAT